MGERGRENLYDVVSEGVRDEQMGLVDDRVHETIVIERRGTQEELLDHAAAMAMRGDLGVRERGERESTSMQCWTSSSKRGVQNDSGRDCRQRRITWLPWV